MTLSQVATEIGANAHASAAKAKKQFIKCVVWDLDNTLWDGVLLEDSNVVLRDTVVDVIKTLDSRGILHSIASRNDHAMAMEKLKQLGLHRLFSVPADYLEL